MISRLIPVTFQSRLHMYWKCQIITDRLRNNNSLLYYNKLVSFRLLLWPTVAQRKQFSVVEEVEKEEVVEKEVEKVKEEVEQEKYVMVERSRRMVEWRKRWRRNMTAVDSSVVQYPVIHYSWYLWAIVHLTPISPQPFRPRVFADTVNYRSSHTLGQGAQHIIHASLPSV